MTEPEARDRARLRGEILSEIIQSPLTLVPLGTSILSGVWMFALQPSLYGVAGLCGGAALALIGAGYNLFYRGEAIRDKIVARWDADLVAAEQARRANVLRCFNRQSGARDLCDATTAMLESYDEARRILGGDDISATHRGYFLPQVEKNMEEAMEVAEKLVKLQDRLADLLDPPPEHGSVLYATIAGLRQDRVKFVGHIRAVRESFERITAEVVNLGSLSLDDAKRSLKQLDESLDLAKRAYQELDGVESPAAEQQRSERQRE